MRPLAEVIAEEFVLEYLQREPEIEDVVEFTDEEFPDYPGAYSEVFQNVVALLGDEAQRFADRHN